MQAAVLVALLLAAAGLASALDFEMQAQQKCIFEELNANVIVVGDYKAVNKDSPTLPIYVDVKVRQRGAAQRCSLSPPPCCCCCCCCWCCPSLTPAARLLPATPGRRPARHIGA